jgi:type II secretory pathway component PulF
MATFDYTARDPSGNEFSGTYRDINGVATLRSELEKIGYLLIRARKAQNPSHGLRRIRATDIVAFAYKFSGMYSAGLSVVACLKTLESQTEKPALRTVLTDIRARIEAGSSLAKAFESHKGVFSGFFIGMLEAGEASGKLGEALQMSAIYLDKRSCLRTKIKSAFVYPIVVGTVCLGVLSCLLLFVVPVFTRLYANLHVALPWPTLVLVTTSKLMTTWGLLLLPGLAMGMLGLRKLTAESTVRNRLDRWKLRLPVLGKLNRLILASRFIRPFAMLVSVGISVIEAFRIAGDIVENEEMRHISQSLQDAAQAGNPVGAALAAHTIFPPTIVQMAISGEQVGKLAEMLTKGADLLDRDIEMIIAGLVVKLEPILTVVMGLVIGLVLLGVYLPVFDYLTHLK